VEGSTATSSGTAQLRASPTLVQCGVCNGQQLAGQPVIEHDPPRQPSGSTYAPRRTLVFYGDLPGLRGARVSNEGA
jgi:hypothetical protein